MKHGIGEKQTEPARAAYNAVLMTTELLEIVLSHVPAKELLTAQRVSCKWRDVIRGNDELQQKLFFKKALPPAPDNRWVRRWTKDAKSEDTKYRKACVRVDKLRAHGHRPPDNEQVIARAAQVNLFLESISHKRGLRHTLYKLPKGYDKGDFAEASWRSQGVSYPPPKEITCYAQVVRKNGKQGEVEEGIVPGRECGTLGEVVDAVARGYMRKGRLFNWSKLLFKLGDTVHATSEEIESGCFWVDGWSRREAESMHCPDDPKDLDYHDYGSEDDEDD